MAQSSLAETLRVLRARRDLTITDAASRIGITRETLRDLEHGTRNPYYPTLEKIARAYGVSAEQLMLPAADAELVAPPKVESRSQLEEDEVRHSAGLAKEAVEQSTPDPLADQQAVVDFFAYEATLGELPAAKRLKVLKQWCEHFENLRDRRHLDISEKRGVLAYGRWLEMYALDELDKQRYIREGVHTHTERVTRGELEVSQEERELCMRVNAAIAYAQNLTNEVRELAQERQDALERDVQQEMQRFLRKLRLKTRAS